MKYLLLFLAAGSILQADLPALSESQVSSTHASYDGNALILQGRVQLEHGLGIIQAEEAFLQKQENNKDFPFSFISLKKDVLLSLKNEAKLSCSFADLDFHALTGVLTAAENERVRYQDLLKKDGKNPVPFEILGSCIDLQLAKKISSSDSLTYEIDSLLAKGPIQIQYAKDFSLESDEALYEASSPSSKSLQGKVHAYPKDPSSQCRLSYLGESLLADRIDIDIDQSELTIAKPKGSLPFHFFGGNGSGKLSLESGKLFWNHLKNILVLQDKVHLKEPNLGLFYAENSMTLEQGSDHGKPFIKSAHIEGPSRLEYESLAGGLKQVISCFGTLHVDGLKGQITMTSPAEEKQQIEYVDGEMRLLADHAFLEYSDQTYEPISLTLKGNVSVRSATSEKPFRCAIADRLSYCPDTKTLILSALPKKKVLFSDEEQHIAMSAQEVHLTQDSVTGKTQVKGIGNVKFFLSSEENSLLQAWIPSYRYEVSNANP